MRDIVQTLSRIAKLSHSRKHQNKELTVVDEITVDIDQLEVQTPKTELQREESVESSVDMTDT